MVSEDVTPISPFFSIVTITLNSEKYLAETIESVINQNFKGKEHIIIDGGSTDGTLDILKKYDRHIRWISEPDEGISDAMNKGIKMSNGLVIAHLHSDDRYGPETLLTVHRLFSEHPDKKWLYGNVEFIDEKGKLLKKTRLQGYNYKKLKRLNCISHPSVFIKKEVFDKVGCFDPSLRYAMDYDMWVRIGKYYEPYQTSDFLSAFRIHEGSLSSAECMKAFDEEYKIRLNNYESESLREQYCDYVRYRLLLLIKRFRPV